MLRQIFVTGASGFIGQNLINRLETAANCHIKMLVRAAPTSQADDQIERVVGDLLKPETYRAALEGCDAVVHLAAATGRATRGEYEHVNVEGTRALLGACKAAGVRRFLHVSTIAAGYPNKRYYPYAQTKAKAEALIKESGLDFAIVRPTIVLGEKSPIWKTLTKIAGLPVILMPQGRPVRVQPIHVNDVVRGIECLMMRDRFKGEILELGGPRPMPFREFLQLVQRALRGTPDKIIGVPLAPIRFGLAIIEPLLRPLMPVTAGQLAIFANDSVASENWLLTELRVDMPSTEETIAALASPDGRRGGPKSRALEQMRQGSPLSESRSTLGNECRSFTAYLVGHVPSAYVEERYVTAAQVHGLARDETFSSFDRATLRIARRGRIFARWADAYCAFFCRRGALRRKLVLLAAILEHVAPTSETFDRVEPSNAIRIMLALVGYGVTSVVSLLLGAAILLPTSLFCWIATRSATSDLHAR